MHRGWSLNSLFSGFTDFFFFLWSFWLEKIRSIANQKAIFLFSLDLLSFKIHTYIYIYIYIYIHIYFFLWTTEKRFHEKVGMSWLPALSLHMGRRHKKKKKKKLPLLNRETCTDTMPALIFLFFIFLFYPSPTPPPPPFFFFVVFSLKVSRPPFPCVSVISCPPAKTRKDTST